MKIYQKIVSRLPKYKQSYSKHSVIGVIGIGVILSACGMKGALVLPEKADIQHSNSLKK